MRDQATAYLLDPKKGYQLSRQGTSGVTCLVERTAWEHADFRNDIYVPVCYDAEGSKTFLKVIIDTTGIPDRHLRFKGRFYVHAPLTRMDPSINRMSEVHLRATTVRYHQRRAKARRQRAYSAPRRRRDPPSHAREAHGIHAEARGTRNRAKEEGAEESGESDSLIPATLPPDRTPTKAFAKGDYVVLIWEREAADLTDPSKKYKYNDFDLFRVENGQLAEHWEGAMKNPPNGAGKE